MRRRKKKGEGKTEGRILRSAARADRRASGCLALFLDMTVARPANFSSKAGWMETTEPRPCFSRGDDEFISLDEFGRRWRKEEEPDERSSTSSTNPEESTLHLLPFQRIFFKI